MLSETITQSNDFRTRPSSFFSCLKRKADHKCGFNDFRQKFPELCVTSTNLLNTPQTPSDLELPAFDESSECSKTEVSKMSSSVSQPALNIKSPSEESSKLEAEMTQILDFVFLGSQEDAQNPTTLKQNGITKVINLSDCPKSDLILNNDFMRIPIRDSHDAKILPHFDQAYDFIEEARRKNQRVLVHCLAGISRSPTLCIAYMMRAKSWTCDEAYKFVKARRPSVSPNLNFVGQLFLYERHLRDAKILPPCTRPRSNVIDDFNPSPSSCKEQVQTTSPRPLPPVLITEKLCKSASVDFSTLSPSSDSSTTDNSRKRMMEMPLSLPCRPRQLMKNCCLRKKLDQSPQLPSPSTEFSKLGISLINPCFGTPTPIIDHKTQPQTSAQMNVENPVFGLDRVKTTDTPKSTSTKKSRHHLLSFLARRHGECKLSTNRKYTKLRVNNSSPLIKEESSRPVFEGVRFRQNQRQFGRLSARTQVDIMPTLLDDDSVDSGKGTSVSHSVSTEDGEAQTEEEIIITSSAEDPEKVSISSGSSLEIAVQ